MSISFDQARQQMTKIRASLKNEVDAIRDNRNYSDAGRKLEIAKAYRANRTKAAALLEEFTAENKKRRRELERRLFGIPNGGDASAYRDAVDRAAKILNAEQAEAMLERAQRTGDTLLARAVADRAHAHGWRNAVVSYAEDADLTRALDELSELPSSDHGIGTAALFGLTAPNELGGVKSTGLDQLIDDTEKQLASEPSAPQRAGITVF